jgi:hypothetical protein
MPMIPVRIGMAPERAVAICNPRLFMPLLPILPGVNSLYERLPPRSKLALQVPEPKSDPSTAILQTYLKNRELQFKHRTSASNRLYCARCRTAARARVPAWSQVAPELADCWRAAARC